MNPSAAIPNAAGHGRIPCEEDDIAWQYLLPESRMRRWTETVRILDLKQAQREITIDFAIPDDGDADRRWMIPTAFFGKFPVASDLEVRNAAGEAISPPTKPENMAMTMSALRRLDGANVLSLGASPRLDELVRQVIFSDSFEARVARLVAEDRMDPNDYLLRLLLRALEDQFLLWIPAEGPPRSMQQVKISRGQALERNQLIPRRRLPDKRRIETPLGPVDVKFLSARGRRRFEFPVALQRLLSAFGTAPVWYWHEVTEARRFTSFHLRVLAPKGLMVRDVSLKAARIGTETLPEPEMHEVRNSPGLKFDGRESEIGHLHCSQKVNPSLLLSSTTIGIRDGLTGLWAGAVVFTVLLLWAIHRLAPPDLSTASNGQLDATVAVLLVGPTLASVWAIRADSGAVLQRMLSGARALLLTSAALAVVTALSLAGFQPFRLDNEQAVEIYASLSYAVAVLIVIGWVVTLRFTWLAYRSILTDARRNIGAVSLLSFFCLIAVAHGGLPIRVVGFILLGSGVILAALAVHPARASKAVDFGHATVLAGVAAVGALLPAGYFLGFYENVLSEDILRPLLFAFEGLVLAAAAVQAVRAP